ncbi:MAG: hypothetical protein JWN21_926 [Sphingomonas bacterium]|uniref:YdeI/OmpD-associated family protein n=1 Tax=Sphingomonas bacterium TaxID=1895847 RepID=UPI0026218E98|nr:YdeI/OmpD-associated family protein [Sphingomonas bacterium]MDB5695383.1 hypothetical protein [Sphingomonas bacterium]
MTRSRTFTHVLAVGDYAFAIRLPFDPKEALGRTRAPVVVAIGGYEYRSTVTTMGGGAWIPFRRSHREAVGATPGEPLTITVALDREERRIDPPADLRAALEAAGAWGGWERLSFTHQREHTEAVEGAKKPETRARRIAACAETLRSR